MYGASSGSGEFPVCGRVQAGGWECICVYSGKSVFKHLPRVVISLPLAFLEEVPDCSSSNLALGHQRSGLKHEVGLVCPFPQLPGLSKGAGSTWKIWGEMGSGCEKQGAVQMPRQASGTSCTHPTLPHTCPLCELPSTLDLSSALAPEAQRGSEAPPPA